MVKRRVAAWLIQILGLMVPAAIMATILLPTVYQIRGYVAFGGEWLIIILAGVVGGRVTHHFVKATEERNHAGIRSIQQKRKFQMFTIQSEGECTEETAANF